MRVLSLSLLSLVLVAAPASAHGLVAVGYDQDTDADLLAVSVFGNATGAIAVSMHGDAQGSMVWWRVCGPHPCASAYAQTPTPERLVLVGVGLPHAPNGIVVSDGDTDADTLSVSLFGSADCWTDCSGSSDYGANPQPLVGVSVTGCANGLVAVSASDCADGFVAVSQDGLDDGDGDEFVIDFLVRLLP
ncbi:MAG TPA: hypothetical protein VFH78_08730 [Candidatus Thermoplasmatota archaeon]|nr:hypothetical protein [Candidatus Thermoplasmatota archaeon]